MKQKEEDAETQEIRGPKPEGNGGNFQDASGARHKENSLYGQHRVEGSRTRAVGKLKMTHINI